jgi:hypothetical protein
VSGNGDVRSVADDGSNNVKPPYSQIVTWLAGANQHEPDHAVPSRESQRDHVSSDMLNPGIIRTCLHSVHGDWR